MSAIRPRSRCPRVAYFCMEYGLDPSLPIYSGGLGVLAGDVLKGAADLRMPMVGVGIKWKYGYVRQQLDGHDSYDAYRLADDSCLKDTGVTVTVPIRGADVACRVWLCDAFGNVPLYLLDTDIDGNPDSAVTHQLYGGNGENRVAQEMVLGIGGVRALRALGLTVDLYHFNEGHAVFAGLELIQEKVAAGQSVGAATDATRREVVFTTHTPVAAGNESHPISRVQYMGADLGLSIEDLVAIGGRRSFNMTVAGLRLAKSANAVAALHGETARSMWAPVDRCAPIVGITNGVHPATWADKSLSATGPVDRLWKRHQRNKAELLDIVSARTGHVMALDRLLIGFSRRATSYKRWTLLFKRKREIMPLLKDRRLQIVFAGKCHPMDAGGRALIREVLELADRYPQSIAFLPDYDMALGRALTRGCDVWLNCPRRPSEASGTSGMKAAMNGVLNLSILDGWWPEACRHGINGWQFGDGMESSSESRQDNHDARCLMQVLRDEVLPLYDTDRNGWTRMMQRSIRDTREKFSIQRMLREYESKLYRS